MSDELSRRFGKRTEMLQRSRRACEAGTRRAEMGEKRRDETHSPSALFVLERRVAPRRARSTDHRQQHGPLFTLSPISALRSQRILDRAGKTALPNASALQKGIALDLKDIKAVIDLMKQNDLTVFEMEKDGFRLKLQKGVSPDTVMTMPQMALPPAAGAPAQAGVQQGSAAAAEKGGVPLKDVTSPMVGTFYRAGAPDAAPFVDVGAEVNEESVVCIIEAMKVMNEIKAEVQGVIAEIVAENGKPVQFGQVLFRVR
jgi:acetyl-CoA carboxylase biotin carboxyl carrier protein